MMLGVQRQLGFDYAAAADNGDDSGGADAFWAPRKRPRYSGPPCPLNMACVDVPEIWSNVAAEEAGCGGGGAAEGIHRPRCSREVESVAGGAGDPVSGVGELQERPSELAKRKGNVGLRRSLRLEKAGGNAEGSPCAVNSPQLLAPLRTPESDESEVSENFDVGICEGDKSELVVEGPPRCSNKAAPVERFASSIPPGVQVHACLAEARSTEVSVNAAQRRFPPLVKHTADNDACELSTGLLPKLSATSGTTAFDTFAPPTNLGSDARKEHFVRCEFVESFACSNKAESPKSSANQKSSVADLPNFHSEAGSTEGPFSASQRPSFQSAKLSCKRNERDTSIILALPALPHFSSPHRTSRSDTVEFSYSSSVRACKEASLRPQSAEPVISLGKVGSYESPGTQEHSSAQMSKCSGEGKLTEKPTNVPPRRSPRLKKDTVHGNVCDPLNPMVLHELTGSLAAQNVSGSVTCKRVSPRYKTVEEMQCSGKLEESPEFWETWKPKDMTGEAGSLGDSDNECQDQSLRLTEDDDCNNGCERARKLDKSMEGTQDNGKICKEERPRITPTVKDLGRKKDAHCKETITRKKVKETLRLFQAICRKLLRAEESKAREPCHNNRVDLMALNIIKDNGKCLNVGAHRFGSIPGVEIGDEFHYRTELSIIGLHRNVMAGISYAKYGVIYAASSIVFYMGYSDFMSSSDVLLYSGSGANPNYYYKSKNQQYPGDQKLERGNLALKNSMDARIPIRVVFGLKESKVTDFQTPKAKGSVTYVYDGLYKVEKCWSELGGHGFSIFKFQLRRMPGQRQLAIRQVQNSEGFKVQHGLHMEDVSDGKERMPVRVVNTIDNECPLSFKYINRVIYPSWQTLTSPSGCDCTDGCSDSVNCACAVKNGGEIPYNYDGAIVEAKPLVYECGPSCKCPPSCHNRVSQHGIKYPLEVFKTKSIGWGARSLTSIPSGSFICEYTGEMIEEYEANRRTNDDYLFDIGQNYYDKSLWEGLSTCIPGLQQDASSDVVEDKCFTIDAANFGNIGRFFNHSCAPNLYAQNVLYDHDDKRMPHIMFFATENIAPLEELTYHYNYPIDQVRDLHGNIKKKNCYCGSAECTGRLY